MSERLFVIPGVAVPTPHPDGGVFYLQPMNQVELKRLAKRIVRFEYLTDKKGKHVFNPQGQAVPKFDQDDDAVVVEAMTRCARIDEVAIPLQIKGEQQFAIGEDQVSRPVRILVTVDCTTQVCDGGHEDLVGRCDRRFRVDSKPVLCARIIVGDFESRADTIMQEILSGSYEYEEELPAAPATAQPEAPADIIATTGKLVTGDTLDDETPAPAPAPTRKKVQQLVAEWVVNECVKLGEAKRARELGN
jgi:hypothetical protein